MNWHRKLYPSFLIQLDKHLLENKPHIWATHFHKHIYLCIVVMAGLSLFALVYPISLKGNLPRIEEFFVAITFLSFFWFCYWVYKSVLFNRDFNFGIRKWYDPYLEVFLYALNILFILLIPIVFTFILSYRVAHLETDAQFIKDVNEATVGYNYIPQNDLSYVDIESDDIYYSFLFDQLRRSDFDQEMVLFHEREFNFSFEELNQEERKAIKRNSHLKFRNNKGECMRLNSFEPILDRFYGGFVYSENKRTIESKNEYFWKKFDFIKNHYKHDSPQYRTEMISKMYDVFAKYGLDLDNDRNDVSNELNSCRYMNTCLNRVELKHTKTDDYLYSFEKRKRTGPWIHIYCSKNYLIPSKFSYIKRCKKYDFYFLSSEYFLFGLVNICLIMAFLIFLFNAVHWKNFLFAFCAVLILIPLNGIIIAVSRSDEISFLITFFLLFISGAYFFFSSKNQDYHFLKVVCVILLMCGLPYVSMIIHFILEDYFDLYESSLFQSYLSNKAEELRQIDMAKEIQFRDYNDYFYSAKRMLVDQIYLLTLFGGLALTFACLPGFKNVFNRYLALPRRK